MADYLSTCRKKGVDSSVALECMFRGKWPAFIQDKLNELGICAE